jgi:hypothetical protein
MMIDQRQLVQWFDARIRSNFAKARRTNPGLTEDGLTFLLKHERKERVINNLMAEVVKAELKMGKRLKLSGLQAMAESLADFFMQAALEAHAHRMMSPLEIQRRVDENTRMDRLQAEMEADTREYLEQKTRVYQSGPKSSS